MRLQERTLDLLVLLLLLEVVTIVDVVEVCKHPWNCEYCTERWSGIKR
jgi:hypothetical protein